MAGCGGGETFRNGEYRGAEVRYAVGPLNGPWQRVDVEGANDLAFRNPDLAAVIQVNASCEPDLDIPLEALTNHLLIGFTERMVRRQELVPMAEREALYTHVEAKLDGVPRELALTVLKKNGCVYDFALVAPPGEPFTRARTAFDGLLSGFETKSP